MLTCLYAHLTLTQQNLHSPFHCSNLVDKSQCGFCSVGWMADLHVCVLQKIWSFLLYRNAATKAQVESDIEALWGWVAWEGWRLFGSVSGRTVRPIWCRSLFRSCLNHAFMPFSIGVDSKIKPGHYCDVIIMQLQICTAVLLILTYYIGMMTFIKVS